MGSIRLDVPGSVEVLVETVNVEGSAGIGYKSGDGEGDAPKLAPANIVKAIQAVAKGFAGAIDGKKGSPEQLGVSFAVSPDSKGRVLIGESGAFKVSLRWEKDD